MLRTLDANLDLLGAGRRHYLMTEAQVQGDVPHDLSADSRHRPATDGDLRACAPTVSAGPQDEPVLRWYSYKMGRPGRDLPIEQALARDIDDWLEVREALSIPKGSRQYLFPAVTEVSAEPYLRPPYFACHTAAVGRNIPFIGSGIVDSDGNEIEFDRSNIYPYSFRHSWAQRHADSGTQIEVLAELLDHEGLDYVGVYYRVSDKRKRSAIAKVAQHTFNHRGTTTATGRRVDLSIAFAGSARTATAPNRPTSNRAGRPAPSGSNAPAAASTDPIRRTWRRSNRRFTRCARIMNGHWRWTSNRTFCESIEGQIASYSRIVAEMKKSIEAMPEDERNNLLEAADHHAAHPRRPTAPAEDRTRDQVEDTP